MSSICFVLVRKIDNVGKGGLSSSVLAIGEAGLDRLGRQIFCCKRGVCPTNFIERVSRKTIGYSLCEGV